MKVTRCSTRVVRTPADEPLLESEGAGSATRAFVLLHVETDEGIGGIGLTLFGGPLISALRAAVDALAELVIGENPLHVEAIATKLRTAAGFAGPGGIFTLALAAIDIALWDIKGKALGQPVWALIGGARDRVPTYASGALGRSMPVALLAMAAARLVGMGFTQMKMQLGGAPAASAEVERVQMVRESIGDEIALMADANQRWTVKQALDIGGRLERYHLFWLEDVVAHDDIPGQARVAAGLTTPLAAGEYHYGVSPFRALLEAGAVDVVMIDLVRVGGVTPWLKVAGMAAAFHRPVVSHLLPEMAVHLVAGVSNGLTVEYMPWTLRLFQETPRLEGGHLVVPQRPGWGLTVDEQAIKQYEVTV